MDDGGDDKHREHGSCSESPVGQLEGLDKEEERVCFRDQGLDDNREQKLELENYTSILYMK